MQDEPVTDQPQEQTDSQPPAAPPEQQVQNEAPAQQVVEAPAAPPPVANDSSKHKILLVEDDVALAAVYRSRLELEGFELYEVNDGEQALQAAKEFQPDLILLDAMMPKISGFDVLDILRNTPETTNIKVVMLTALSQPKDKERAESLGVDDYLVKSQVVIGDVVDRVKHHLGMES
jgi:CheY-like chemotaxis protein